MLITLRDNDGFITAACEWWCVDEDGKWDPAGTYVFVNQLEHSPDAEGFSCIQDIIAEIAWTAPWAKAAYWERRGKEDKRLHAFTRQQLLRVPKEVRT